MRAKSFVCIFFTFSTRKSCRINAQVLQLRFYSSKKKKKNAPVSDCVECDFKSTVWIEIVLGDVDALKRPELKSIMEVRRALTCVFISVFLWTGDAQDSVPDSGESLQSRFHFGAYFEILVNHILLFRTLYVTYANHMF